MTMTIHFLQHGKCVCGKDWPCPIRQAIVKKNATNSVNARIVEELRKTIVVVKESPDFKDEFGIIKKWPMKMLQILEAIERC